jgi:hypothetical protein
MIVGTAENHVTSASAACRQKREAEKRDVIASDPPETRLPITVTQSPLM